MLSNSNLKSKVRQNTNIYEDKKDPTCRTFYT